MHYLQMCYSFLSFTLVLFMLPEFYFIDQLISQIWCVLLIWLWVFVLECILQQTCDVSITLGNIPNLSPRWFSKFSAIFDTRPVSKELENRSIWNMRYGKPSDEYKKGQAGIWFSWNWLLIAFWWMHWQLFWKTHFEKVKINLKLLLSYITWPESISG